MQEFHGNSPKLHFVEKLLKEEEMENAWMSTLWIGNLCQELEKNDQ
jgi:hypothetical protein